MLSESPKFLSPSIGLLEPSRGTPNMLKIKMLVSVRWKRILSPSIGLSAPSRGTLNIYKTKSIIKGVLVARLGV